MALHNGCFSRNRLGSDKQLRDVQFAPFYSASIGYRVAGLSMRPKFIRNGGG
jgi:hypothetical protein